MVILSVFLLKSEISAQTHIGITTGFNLSKAVYLEKENEQIIKPYRTLKPGFNAGLFLIQKLNPIISVEMQIVYSQKGLKMIQEPYHKTLNTMNYNEIPVSSHFKIRGNKFNSLYIEGGGFVSFWTDGKYKEYDLNNTRLQNLKVDFNNDTYEYSRIDYGVLCGAKFKLEKIVISLKYTLSLTGSSKNEVDALSNRILGINLGYYFKSS